MAEYTKNLVRAGFDCGVELARRNQKQHPAHLYRMA